MTLQSGSASSQHQVSVSRRNFLQAAGVCVAAGTFGAHSALSFGAVARQDETPLYEISLAEWSLHRALQSGRREHLDLSLIHI